MSQEKEQGIVERIDAFIMRSPFADTVRLLRECANVILTKDRRINRLTAEIASLKAELERAREVLRLYSDPNNWTRGYRGLGTGDYAYGYIWLGPDAAANDYGLPSGGGFQNEDPTQIAIRVLETKETG